MVMISRLQQRLTRDGARPLFIHYDGETRIELSGTTFANWVDKTANLLENLGVEPGEVVSVPLATTHPGHWVTSVWVAACWQRGCRVVPGADADAELTVVGPEGRVRGQTVACSLHPLGRGFDSPPEGCIDYVEVLGEPDVHLAVEPEPGLQAWPHVTFSDLAQVPPRTGTALFVDPAPGFETVAELLVAPILGGGATVVATGVSDVARIRAQERL